MEFVQMHEGLVRFPAIDGFFESGPPDVELQSLRCLIDELLLILLSYSQRIGVDGIVDERTKVVDVCHDLLAGH